MRSISGAALRLYLISILKLPSIFMAPKPERAMWRSYGAPILTTHLTKKKKRISGKSAHGYVRLRASKRFPSHWLKRGDGSTDNRTLKSRMWKPIPEIQIGLLRPRPGMWLSDGVARTTRKPV